MSIAAMELNAIILALTPMERWEAMRNLNIDFLTQRWFIFAGAAIIAVLIILLIWVSHNLRMHERKISSSLFAEYAGKKGLSFRERQILLDIAVRAGLKQNESIFTMPQAFDYSVSRMLDECLSQEGIEESNQLRIELSFLRQKLGFPRIDQPSAGSLTASKLTTRQIPAGKLLSLNFRSIPLSGIDSTVMENGDAGLLVRLSVPAKINPGDFCCVRYYFGSAIWEFDSKVMNVIGDILVLSGSQSVRFVERRRFHRVPVRSPAYIASFPFDKNIVIENKKTESAKTKLPETPEFLPAVVTELAGLGLRIDVPVEFKKDSRVIVVFSLKEKTILSSQPGGPEKEIHKVIEDIGIVRNVKTIKNGFSIAVELTGLRDSEVDVLICATNIAERNGAQSDYDLPANKFQNQVPVNSFAQGI